MEAPIAVERDERLAVAYEIKGLGAQDGCTCHECEGKRGEEPKTGTKAHRGSCLRGAVETWFDANAAGGLCVAGFARARDGESV